MPPTIQFPFYTPKSGPPLPVYGARINKVRNQQLFYSYDYQLVAKLSQGLPDTAEIHQGRRPRLL